MGVVHEHSGLVGRWRSHALEAPGNRRHLRQPSDCKVEVHVEGCCCCECDEGVVHVDPTRDRELYRAVTPAEGAPFDSARNVGGVTPADGSHRNRRAPHEALSPGVIDENHGTASVLLGEQHGLGVEVGLHGLVEVEVVMAQIREDGEVELDCVDPLEREGVARDFHGDEATLPDRSSIVSSISEERCELWCFGSRPRSRERPDDRRRQPAR